MGLKMEAKPELHDANPAQASVNPITALYTKEIPRLGSIMSVRKEVDDVLEDMKFFHVGEPDQVMAAVSAHGARLVELSVQIQRIVAIHKEWKQVLDEVNTVLSELKSQFQVASRLIAVRQMDYEMSGRGQV